jgi:hypothetical protein
MQSEHFQPLQQNLFSLSNEALLVPLETQSEQRTDCKRMISCGKWKASAFNNPT